MMTNITTYFRELVSLHMGLIIPQKDEAALEQLLASRTRKLELPSTTAYYSFLAEEQPESELEWRRLAHYLTIGESYFFRDNGQMRLLEKVIIPELLQSKTGEDSLRILSAGCATGEEPYSVAMMIDRLVCNPPIPRLSGTHIFGVDINEEALKIAQSGKYGSWSFRGVPEEIQKRYFQRTTRHWLLDKEIREKVKFRRLNLVKDPLPSEHNDIQDMDLILCRNVNIYFKRETVAQILDKLVNTLRPGGYLMTGHAELQGIAHPRLKMHSHPESVIYQRVVNPNTPESVTRMLPTTLPPPLRSIDWSQPKKAIPKPGRFFVPVLDAPILSTQTKASEVEQKEPPVAQTMDEHPELLLRNGHYRQVIAHAQRIVERDESDLGSWRLKARAHANLGELKEAEFCCEQMIKIDAFYAHAYYLKAHIAMERGDKSKTKELLKRTLYLDHTFIAPHLELADIHAREGNAEIAKRMRVAALRLLRALPDGAQVEMIDEYTAGDLLRDIEKLV